MYIYVKYFTWCNLINLVDNANAATPVAPFIAAHLNFLKFSLFFIFVYEYLNAAIDEIVPIGSP